MRWNRVWETDRATRLDRMGSPAKWMRRGGIYRRLPRAAATEDRLREVAQVNYSFFHRDPPIRTPRTQSAGDEEDHGNFLSKGYL